MCSCNRNKGTGIFAGYQAFWIVVVIAIVIIWVHYGIGCNGVVDSCGCSGDSGDCGNCGGTCGCNF